MGFNELNSVEHYIIHQLCGVNLNDSNATKPKVGSGAFWESKSLQKSLINQVF